MRDSKTGKQTVAVQRVSSAPPEEENILLHDICVHLDWSTQLSINPCDKLLPYVSQIRIAVSKVLI